MKKKNNNPLYSKDLERALEQRAREDLEAKAREKARSEYNYNKYMQKKAAAENRARWEIRRHEYRKPVLFFIIMALFCLYLYLDQQGIHISDLISDTIYLIQNGGA